MARYSRPLVVLLLAVPSALGGCSTETEKDSGLEQATNRVLGGLTPEASATAERIRASEVEELVARCMKKKGFTYRPDINMPLISAGAVILPPGREVVVKRTSAYGLTTFLERSATSRPTVVPVVDIGNAEEIKAYNLALSGSENIELQLSPENGGCRSKAALTIQAKYTPIWAKSKKMGTDIRQDPSHRSIVGRWSRCMKNGGFTVSEPTDVMSKILEPALFDVLKGFDFRAGDDGAVEDFKSTHLADFRSLEFRVARLDADCMPQKDVDTLRSLSQKYRQQFVEENKDEIIKLNQ